MIVSIIITITIIASFVLFYKDKKYKQKALEARLEQERLQKELEARVEQEKLQQKELEAKLEQEKLQRELEVRQEQERLQREFEAKLEQERLQRELEARLEQEKLKQRELEAKLEQERLQKEFEERQERERVQKEQHENFEKLITEIERKRKLSQILLSLFVNQLNAIGATFIKTNNGNSNITANENINIINLFSLLEHIGGQHHILITNLEGSNLIEILFNKDYCHITIVDDDEQIFNKGNFVQQAAKFLYCYLENRKIARFEDSVGKIIENGISQIEGLSTEGNSIEEKVCSALESSNYEIEFQRIVDCSKENDMLIVDYELPNISILLDIKEYKYVVSTKQISAKKYTNSYISKRYEDVLYSITLRSLYEIFYTDTENKINGTTFNGFVTQVNPANGNTERKCIISIQVNRNKFSQINLSFVDPKVCFKSLKGVSAAKLIDISPITPILTFNKEDKRFVEGKEISVNQGTNLAAMHWEDFEHLVRELFEMEFAKNGGEVRVTQASRDGGVDAIVFDPDPLRGGKIVIQAKRYTNTVGVSAVRDLYGTVINEGANTGILITTSDYGHDSYDFAKDKPLKLLNGGHLLALLHKNGRKAHINIEEAKMMNVENRNL